MLNKVEIREVICGQRKLCNKVMVIQYELVAYMETISDSLWKPFMTV
jgi:hypothetical protein